MSFDEFDSLVNKPQGSQPPPAKHPIVVIDDDESIRDNLALLLGDRYRVTLCASAKEGLNAVDEDVCAVIVDIKMPRQDGFWACAYIRKKVPDVPIIFYSAYHDVKDPYSIINEFRPFGYVDKGDDIQKLVDILNVAVQLQAIIIFNRRLIQKLQGPAR